MVSWWNGDTDPLSHRAWDILSGNNGAYINGATNGPGGLVNVLGDSNTLIFPELSMPRTTWPLKLSSGIPLTSNLPTPSPLKVGLNSHLARPLSRNNPSSSSSAVTVAPCQPYYFGVERVTANTLDLMFHIKDERTADCGIILESAAQPIVAGQWQHVAAVFDANVLWRTNAPWPTNELRLYVNGRQLNPEQKRGLFGRPLLCCWLN